MNNTPVNPAENATVPVFNAAPVPAPEAPVLNTAPAANETPAFAAAPIPNAAPAPTPAPEQPKKKRKLWLIPVCIIGVLLLAAGGIFGFFAMKAGNADELFEAGKYMEARAAYEPLSFLSSYADKVKECDYRMAEMTLEAGNYLVARDQFLELGSYSNSAEMAKECLYRLANKQLEDGDHISAAENFDDLGSYKDSKELYTECFYLNACELEAAREYEDAIEVFELLEGYKDSDSRRVRCAMNLASELYRSDKFEECAKLAEEYAELHPHAALYRILAELGHLREQGAEMERLRAIMDIIAKYTNENPDAKEAMEDPEFFVLRFFGADWEADNGDSLDADLEELTIYYDVSWYTPDGAPWYACDENYLFFFTDKNDEFWFAVTGFDSYDTLHPAEMYVTDNEDKEYVFHNVSSED
ncbi:MAG: hypothetical protein E7554_10740 [Ruminococcaceae bacterium]|nr:hypothetical protein [Oscillospiraceae bacterium]